MARDNVMGVSFVIGSIAMLILFGLMLGLSINTSINPPKKLSNLEKDEKIILLWIIVGLIFISAILIGSLSGIVFLSDKTQSSL